MRKNTQNTQNSRKKPQNSRKKLNFLAFLESFDVKKMSKKDPGCFYTLSYPFIRFRRLYIRVGAISKLHVSTPKSFTFVLKSTMNTKKWYLKVNNHPLIGFLVL